jgi:hypothetical protein
MYLSIKVTKMAISSSYLTSKKTRVKFSCSDHENGSMILDTIARAPWPHAARIRIPESRCTVIICSPCWCMRAAPVRRRCDPGLLARGGGGGLIAAPAGNLACITGRSQWS